MKNYLICIFASAIVAVTFSCDKDEISNEQSESFIKYYTNFPEFTAADVEISGSGYAVLGTAITEDSGTQVCLFKTDGYGNIISKPQLYGRESDDRAYCLKVLSNGDFAILSTSVNPVTQKSEGLFIYTNNTGTPLWSRILTAEGNMEPRYFDVDANGRFFITGYLDVLPDKGKQILIIALNNDGTNYWPNFRNIGVGGDEEGFHLQIQDNGYMLITGRARLSISGSPVYQTFICTVNESGIQEDWSDIVFLSTADVPLESQGQAILSIDQNNCLILSSVKTGTSYTVALSKFNRDANAVLWQEEYTSDVSETAQTCFIENQKVYILATTGATGSNKAISLITAGISGEFQTRTSFGSGTELSASDFAKTSDGGFIITGSNLIAGGNNTSIALIKTLDSGF